MLRFDFTGLGQSEGEFADTHFSSNVQDLLDAAEYLKREHQPPDILVGHSLGGTAMLAAAHRIGSAVAVATIGALSRHSIGRIDPSQVAEVALEVERRQHGRPSGADHTTVLHACRKTKELRESDVKINDDYVNLLRILSN